MSRLRHRSTLFPYTTLFRSWAGTWGGTRRGTWGGTWAGTRRAPWEALCEPDTWHTHLQDHPGPRSPTYNKKFIIIPAATAEPITPETFGAIACINKWLLGSAFRPSCCATRALAGTAETPAAPIKGLTLLPSFKNRFMILAKSKPPAVATAKEMAPSTKILIEPEVKNPLFTISPVTGSSNRRTA